MCVCTYMAINYSKPGRPSFPSASSPDPCQARVAWRLKKRGRRGTAVEEAGDGWDPMMARPPQGWHHTAWRAAVRRRLLVSERAVKLIGYYRDRTSPPARPGGGWHVPSLHVFESGLARVGARSVPLVPRRCRMFLGGTAPELTISAGLSRVGC